MDVYMTILPLFYAPKIGHYKYQIGSNDTQDGYISPPFIFSESICLPALLNL